MKMFTQSLACLAVAVAFSETPQDSKNTSCLRLIILWLTLMGVWNPGSMETNTTRKLAFYLYFLIFQCLIYVPIIVTEVLHVISAIEDVEKIMGISMVMLTHCTMAPKIFAIWYNQYKIKAVLSILDSPAFTRKEPLKQAILEKEFKMLYVTSGVFGLVIVFTGILWGLFPMLKPVLELPLGYPLLNSQDVKFFPIYLYQIISLTVLGVGVASADFLIGGFMVIFSGAMNLLHYEVKNIGVETDHEDLQINSNKEYLEAVNCVKFHGEIMELMKITENMFNLPILIQFLISSVIICSAAFTITMTNNPIEILTMTLYLVCVTNELLVYCYFGDKFKQTSERLADGAYCSGWPRMSVRTRRVILLFMTRAQRPLTFTAGNMFPVTLTTFATVLRTSYSYFALLNQRHAENDTQKRN